MVGGLSAMEKLRRKLKSLKDQILSDDEKAKFESCWSCFFILLAQRKEVKNKKTNKNE